MRQTIDEQNYKTVRALLDANISQAEISRITDISAVTINRIKCTSSFEEFDKERKERTLRTQMARDAANQDPRTAEPRLTGTTQVSPTAESLIAAVNKVAAALEKNNEILGDIYEKIGDSQVSLQELVNAWNSEEKKSLF